MAGNKISNVIKGILPMPRAIITQMVLAWLLGIVIAVPLEAAEPESSWPADGSFVRITREGGVTPYISVYYDVTVRGRTLVVTMTKDTLCRVMTHERVVILDGSDARRVLGILSDAGAWIMRPPVRDRGTVETAPGSPDDDAAYEFWSASGRDMRRFRATRRELLGDPGLTRLLSVVRATVTGLVEPLALRDVFQPADRTGILAITASEPAVALIDGWDRVRLPVSSLDLKVGVHEVVVTGKSGSRRNFTVRVVPGENPAIHVLLGDPPPPGVTAEPSVSPVP